MSKIDLYASVQCALPRVRRRISGQATLRVNYTSHTNESVAVMTPVVRYTVQAACQHAVDDATTERAFSLLPVQHRGSLSRVTRDRVTRQPYKPNISQI